MANLGSYRIRWARVRRLNGQRSTKERMCIGERRFRLGWWPIGEWRFRDSDAQDDIESDRRLRNSLPPIQYL